MQEASRIHTKSQQLEYSKHRQKRSPTSKI